MPFIIGLIVNGILLSIPIGATLGTLFGIRPFEDEKIPLVLPQDSVLSQSTCDEFNIFAQNKNGANYTINSNTILADPDSTLCMSMTTFQNNTYPSNSTAPPFSVTWSYPFVKANITVPKNFTPVVVPRIHAFPQATIANLVPLALENIGAFLMNFTWTMGVGDEPSPSTNLIRLNSAQVNSSVALDMYLDDDQETAKDVSTAAYEIILYFMQLGLQDPVGFGNGTVRATETLCDVDFELFTGKNDNKQNVFSWVTTDTTEEFNCDLTPLFNTVLNLRSRNVTNVALPKADSFLGYVGFGTQAFNSIGDVTFTVPKLSMDIRPFEAE